MASDAISSATTPLQERPSQMYIAYGALGAYIGGAAMGMYNTKTMPPLTSRPMLESAIIGGVTTYASLVFMPDSVDRFSTSKAMLYGFVGSLVWYKFLRPYAQSSGWVN